MENKPFVHLHVHTEYSKLDGLSQVEDIVKLANEYDMPAVAITDHGTLGGWAPLYRICANKDKNPKGVKPIPGLEAYQSLDRFDNEKAFGNKLNFHLILLAYNEQGYYNLQKINGKAWNESLYRKEYARIDTALIREHSEGIMATTGCIGSLVNQMLLKGRREDALKHAQEMIDILGKDNYFVEIQNHHMIDQMRIVQDQIWLARELGLKMVATQDSHYNHKCDEEFHNDAETHLALLCAGTGSTIDDPTFHFESDENWFRSGNEMYDVFNEDTWSDEMLQLFEDNGWDEKVRDGWREAWHEACDNTLAIADRVDVPSPFERGYFLPDATLGDGFDDPNEYLRHVVFKDMEKYHNGDIPQENIDQANFELDVIREMNFPNYFLLTSEIIKAAKSRGIRIGPGRGSGAGSIVAFHTHITTVHPMKYGLYFERFLNPARQSMPDFDIDVAQHQRNEFIEMLVELYGYERIAHISTFSEYSPKSLIGAVCRVMDIDKDFRAELSSLYPEGYSNKVPNWLLTRGLGSRQLDSDQLKYYRAASDFREAVLTHPQGEMLAKFLVGLSSKKNNIGVHAGGILITPGPVYDLFPVRINPVNGRQQCEFDKKDLEATGGLKMDFLGLRNLSLIELAERLVRDDLNMPDFDIEAVEMDDAKTYRMIANGQNDGVFQLNSPNIQDWIKSMKPDSFWDISALSALNRPGPMGTGSHTEYAMRKNGKKYTYEHPELESILGETYGLIVYQEQVMEIAKHFAGYSMAEADNFRRIMGAKNAEAMANEKVKFIDGFLSRGYTEKLATSMWDTIEPFAEYAFNKAHTVAYGFISFQTAYLKCNYPAQYAAAGFIFGESMPQQVDYCKSIGVHLFPPNINVSKGYSTTTKDSIWLGLSNVIGNWNMIDEIVGERERNGNFTSIGDFTKRVRIAKPALEKLIRVGAFDSLHPCRKALVDNLEEIVYEGKAAASAESQDFGISLFDDDDFSDEIDAQSPLNELMDKLNSSTQDYTSAEKTAEEINILGFFTGEHPYVSHAKEVKVAKANGIIPSDSIPATSSVDTDKNASVYGILMTLSEKKRNGNKRTNFTVETGNDDVLNGIMFGRTIDPSLQGKLVLVQGSIAHDAMDETIMTINAKDVTAIEVSSEMMENTDVSPTSTARKSRRSRSRRIESEVDQIEDTPTPRRERQPKTTTQEKEDNPYGKGHHIIFVLDGVDAEKCAELSEIIEFLPIGKHHVWFKIESERALIKREFQVSLTEDDLEEFSNEFGVKCEMVHNEQD